MVSLQMTITGHNGAMWTGGVRSQRFAKLASNGAANPRGPVPGALASSPAFRIVHRPQRITKTQYGISSRLSDRARVVRDGIDMI